MCATVEVCDEVEVEGGRIANRLSTTVTLFKTYSHEYPVYVRGCAGDESNDKIRQDQAGRLASTNRNTQGGVPLSW